MNGRLLFESNGKTSRIVTKFKCETLGKVSTLTNLILFEPLRGKIIFCFSASKSEAVWPFGAAEPSGSHPSQWLITEQEEEEMEGKEAGEV